MADAPASTEVRTTPGTRLGSFGLFMEAAGPILFLIAGFLWGLGTDDAGFFGVTAAIALVGAFVARRPGTVTKIIAMVLALLTAGALFWTAFGIAVPTSFFEFIPGLLVVPGFIIAIIGCVGALRKKSADPATRDARDGRFIRTATTVLAALAVISGVLTFVSKDKVSSSEADEATATVVLSDFEYDKASYDFQSGGKVLVRNDDPFTHTFTIEALDIDITMSPGSETLVNIPEETGAYVVFCRPHSGDPKDLQDPDNINPDDMAAKVEIN
ncbi:MAG: hypothetical protein QOH90_327 [Actinomycetota bacterium]|nr:hypothetical protein [Actinomycetota bacterium]